MGGRRGLRYHDDSADEGIVVFWNRTTGEGYLESPGYKDGERSCWDSNFGNVACGG